MVPLFEAVVQAILTKLLITLASPVRHVLLTHGFLAVAVTNFDSAALGTKDLFEIP